jgi:glycosyltransferase involved in cell wall biosynthesis
MNVCALVVNHKTLDLTQTLVHSLAKFYPDLPILVIDNGSSDESTEWIRSLPHHLINEINLGHGPALDQGMLVVNADLVFCLDSDCEVIKGGFLEPMIEVFGDPNLYAIGMFHKVNKGGIDTFIQADPEGKEYPYVHPSTGLYRRAMYLDLPPFRHHGSPCIDNMVEGQRRGYRILEYPNIREYVTHPWAGTRDRMDKGKWSLEIGQIRPFMSFVTRTKGAGQGENLCITLTSFVQQADIDFENVIISRGDYYENRNRVYGEYVYCVDEGQSVADPNLISKVKHIVYNHGWPDVINFSHGRAIRREVFRRFSRDLSQVTGTVFNGG